MSIKCKIHNKGPGRHTVFNTEGGQVTVEPGQTVDVKLDEGTFKSLKGYLDDEKEGLNLVSAEVVDDKKGEGEEAADLVSRTKTHEVVLNPDPSKPLNPDPKAPLNPDPNAPLVAAQSASVVEGDGAGGLPPGSDSIDKLLAEIDAKSVSFGQLRSRAKALLGNDFPLGTSPKMDEIVDLLRAAQKKQKAHA